MATEDESSLTELGESIDIPTFEQILEMDDDEEDKEFSRSIVYGFFDQAESTFKDIEDALQKKDLPRLSALGHYLKGSSATLGLNHMRQSCEKIQHLGKHLDETGSAPRDEEYCLKSIKVEFEKLQKDYKRCEKGLRKFYGE